MPEVAVFFFIQEVLVWACASELSINFLDKKNLSATSGRSWSVFSSNRYGTPRKRYMFDILRLSCDSRWIARLQILQLWQWVLTELQVQDVTTESDPPSSWANDWLFMIVTLLRDASDNDWHNIQHRLNVHQTWGCRSLTMDLRDYGGGTASSAVNCNIFDVFEPCKRPQAIGDLLWRPSGGDCCRLHLLQSLNWVKLLTSWRCHLLLLLRLPSEKMRNLIAFEDWSIAPSKTFRSSRTLHI